MYVRTMLNTLVREITYFLRREVVASRRYKATETVYKGWKKVNMTDVPLSRPDPVIMKLDSPEFRSIFTPELQIVADLFEKYNYQLRIAGGAVRDILAGKQPTDLDFATDATPQQMKEMFTKETIRMINDKGEKHGTVTARINDKENFEITTLRIDVLTDGRHAEVEYTKNWKLDANRRDLTINSMFLDLDGKVYDYFYGYDDLQKKRIAFVGDANIRIREDYLRIFRYFRFYGRMMEDPNKHDEATIKAIRENIDGLSQISGERIWMEWSKILTGNFGMELTLKLLECGSSKYIGLPEKPDVENFRIVYQRALSNNVKLKPISLVVSMVKDEQEVMMLHSRLKLSNSDRDLAFFLIQHKEYKPCEKALKPYQHLIFTQSTAKYDVYREYVKEILKYRGAMELLDELERWVMPRFPIGGNMLKEGVPKPQVIGRVMNELRKIWVDEDFKITAEELMKHVPSIVSELQENFKKIQEKRKLQKKIK